LSSGTHYLEWTINQEKQTENVQLKINNLLESASKNHGNYFLNTIDLTNWSKIFNSLSFCFLRYQGNEGSIKTRDVKTATKERMEDIKKFLPQCLQEVLIKIAY